MEKCYALEYYSELKKLKQQNISPTGIYSHLQSYEEFVEWKRRHNSLFFYDDKARELI